MLSRKLLWLAPIVVILAAALVLFRPDRAARVATAAVAHDICSKTFISRFDPQAVFAETITRPGWVPPAISACNQTSSGRR